MKYLEHEKLKEIQKETQLCGEFLEWLMSKYTFCEYNRHRSDDNQVLVPAGYINKQKLLAEFYDIDLDEIEREKRQMLDELRKV